MVKQGMDVNEHLQHKIISKRGRHMNKVFAHSQVLNFLHRHHEHEQLKPGRFSFLWSLHSQSVIVPVYF